MTAARSTSAGADPGRSPSPSAATPIRGSLPLAPGPGRPWPLGADWDGAGTNFAVYTRNAEAVELCLFDDDGHETAVELREHTANIFHLYLPRVGPGQRYGYRVHGPWEPERGLRFNPAKLLVDPYALAIDGDIDWSGPVFGHDLDDPGRPDPTDSAPFVHRSVVVDRSFDWGDDHPPEVDWNDTVIYETHVRGLTMTHPGVPPELRGTYAGMACDAVVDHLVTLGVTAVELMPIHHFVSEGFLREHGLVNYWGYSTLGFLAPHAGYGATAHRVPGSQVQEFKALVKTLHRAGLEVLLDVVYNHTTEGTESGPTLSLRGFDNPVYYRLDPDNPSRYIDWTGTGNSLNVDEGASLQLVMDSLRYWVQDMHVDGFRFDLAPTLAREYFSVDRQSAFFHLVHQDPVVNRVKLIAEPWDVGPDGYQIGNFPPTWSEWNGQFRDDIRDYWTGNPGATGRLASRFAGSSDLYGSWRRRPSSSINFVTAHDGFTLADLVAYEHKHNEANGEGNRDGHDHNLSWNGGVEGETTEPDVLDNRRRRAASLLALLLLSQGVPMLSGGDEIGRTQRGNNNAYCQDNEISWYDWERADRERLAFTRRLIAFRRAHPAFRRRRFFSGQRTRDGAVDIGWYRPDGQPMGDDDWTGHAGGGAVCIFVNGHDGGVPSSIMPAPVDDSFLVLCNNSALPVEFIVPHRLTWRRWSLAVDTAGDTAESSPWPGGHTWTVGSWGVAVLNDGVEPGDDDAHPLRHR
ncbi:MAG: glycogen debranching protein GlgX [Acidimicrobiales bacterium]